MIDSVVKYSLKYVAPIWIALKKIWSKCLLLSPMILVQTLGQQALLIINVTHDVEDENDVSLFIYNT